METLNGADEQVRWEGRCGVMPISDIRPARTDPSNSQGRRPSKLYAFMDVQADSWNSESMHMNEFSIESLSALLA